MRLLLVVLFALLSSGAHAQDRKPISAWPIPSSGNPNLSAGDAVPATRAGVTYKLIAGFGGTCLASKWVNSINAQGVPNCTQPLFSNILGFLGLDQLSGAYTDGQILVGNSGTGKLQVGVVTAGQNVAITNSAGGVAVATLSSVSFGSVAIGSSSGQYPLTVFGSSSAAAFYASTTPGVSCSGSPTGSFATVKGIVTHC